MFENSLLADLTLGRSNVRQRILALLMDESSSRLHLREIQRRAGTSPGTASRELGKLVAAGLIDREAEGNQVYFRVSASPFATMLRSLLVAVPSPEFKSRPTRLSRPKAARAAAAAAAELGPPEATIAERPLDHGTAATEGSSARGTLRRVIRPGLEALDPSALPLATPTETTTLTPTPIAVAATPDPVGLQIAARLSESVRSIYGDALRGIYLYGERACGPAPANADVETIIVLDRVDRYGAELERTSHVYAALSHELRLVASRIFVSETDWNGGSDGVLPAIRDEAVAV